MADRAEKSRRDRREPHPLAVLAGVLAAFLLLAACYVGYQALHILFPQNVYETALPATVSDNVEADGVLLFDEVYVSGSGMLGYLAADGERVSAGTAVAEIYSDASQAVLRQQLTQLTEQIDLLQRSQNTTSLQLDALLRERSAALYDMTGRAGCRSIRRGEQRCQCLPAGPEQALDRHRRFRQLYRSGHGSDPAGPERAGPAGNPTQITAPQTGYFVRASSSGRLNAGADDILAQDPAQLKAYLDSNPTLPLDGCAGKIVSGFTWRYVGVCSAEQGQKLLGQNGKPLSSSVQIRFPGQTDRSFKATVSEVTIDEEQGLARFVLTCNVINGDVLCLNHAAARISVGESTGLRIPASAVHYLKEDGTEAETQGENYIPGVYVKYGNIARFCKIDPVDNDHPLVTDGDYILVLPKGTDGSVSQVRLYDEIIVSGQNLYDGKLL